MPEDDKAGCAYVDTLHHGVNVGRATALLALVNPEAVLVTLIRGSTAVRDKALLVENRSPARAEQLRSSTHRVPHFAEVLHTMRNGRHAMSALVSCRRIP